MSYTKRMSYFSLQRDVLKRDISYKDSEISMLKSELEKLKQEKESNQLKIENFDNASKSLDKLIGSQIPDKSRKGVGFVSYNVVPPPPTGLFSPPKFDLSNSSLEEFQQPEFEGYRPKTSKSVSEDISNEVRESLDAPLVKELVSDDKLEKKTVFLTVAKIEFVRPKQQEKPVRKPAHCNYHQRERVVSGNNYTRVNYNYFAKKSHPSAHRNMVPKAVLMKIGLRSLNTARPVNTAHPKTTVYSARPMSYFSKSAQSTVKRPYQIRTALTYKNFSQKFNTAKGKFYTARPKAVNTARPNSVVVNAVRENQVNSVKASVCWVWRPTKLNSASITLKRHNYVDARGRSKHMTGNMSYLSDFKEFDRGYVTFGGGAKGRKITGKGTLKTGKLDFEDVYFVKELQFNLFSVSQMCDKKKSVLFTNTRCLVLSTDFKLADESQVLLKVNRKNNMYSVDMKNIVPKECLTCLVAKATLDESMLWHRRLGHVNFKTINKLVKENLVRGLPSKRFENDQTCVACLKGKQYKASCKFKIQNSTTQPLFMLHMDLFGPTFVSSLMNKKYCLVVTDDYSRFTWVFFLATKDETSGILKSFITEIENLVDKKVKIISVARTPHHNGVAERRNRTLIEAARTMLADSKLPTTFFPSTPNTRIHKDHSLDHMIGDVHSGVQTRRMTKTTNEQGFISVVYEEAMQEELLQFKLQKVWVLVDLPKGKRAIARIEAIRLFLSYTSFMGFMVYQMDVKSAFLYGKIEEEVYVCQLPGFEEPDYPDKVYKVVKALYGLHQALRACSMGELTFFLGQVKQKEDRIFISQDKYVAGILRKFSFTDVKTASTLMDTKKPLLKDSDGDDVDVHIYILMIGSLMYLTLSRPDIMFVVCACARFQVTPKVSHLHAVKRIFRYLKGQAKLGLWYPRDSSFDLVAYSDSEYAGASLDRKSTIRGCQFLGCRLISWQCKKQTVVATSSTKAEYVAAASCCRQVLWIQNQMLDYGYNFMHIMINIDNNSTICIIKNPVLHSKTKHKD
ncbi:putative ribonuclease H-like domain-containing protein [Tanacetum coccineum]|uniref:Ribonuclease H-like domain-containing protein n=1 Tax=Tanacetum coccineum TaxID=301880 RepID=A0ABQ4YMS1_9ASTR